MQVNTKDTDSLFEKGLAKTAFNSEKNKLWHQIGLTKNVRELSSLIFLV